MSAPDSWLDTGVGEAISAALAITLHPALLLPVLVIYALDKQRELLITALAIVAVRSPRPTRRDAANKILDRLLTASDPRQPSTHTPRRRKTPPAPGR